MSKIPLTGFVPRIRHIILTRSGDTRLVHPDHIGDNGIPLRPFPLPQFPKFLLNWLLALGNTCHRVNQRCIGAVLVLDACTHKWSIRIPHQRLGKDAPALLMIPEDFADLPASVNIAGSFQSIRSAHPRRRFAGMIPTYPGVHFLQVSASRSCATLHTRWDQLESPQ